MNVHLLFDLLAATTAASLALLVDRTWLKDRPRSPFSVGQGYFVVMGLGITLGSFALGTLNLWLSGVPAVGRSVLGALCGGILAVELYKARTGIRGSTGLVFVPAFAALVAIGRIGCALSGLEDNTYGTPTTLPWAVDHGDGILRHPVAAYESLTMALFLILALLAIARRNPLFLRQGFYIMVAVYAVQRFAWEFLKPYAPVLGPLNIFHLACLALAVYAAVMAIRQANA
jgi:phosphatidylglycerol:prolipoprotein diacylglycerol transferase